MLVENSIHKSNIVLNKKIDKKGVDRYEKSLDFNDFDNHILYLKKLQKSDPEFYNFIIKNDSELLNFGSKIKELKYGKKDDVSAKVHQHDILDLDKSVLNSNRFNSIIDSALSLNGFKSLKLFLSTFKNVCSDIKLKKSDSNLGIEGENISLIKKKNSIALNSNSIKNTKGLQLKSNQPNTVFNSNSHEYIDKNPTFWDNINKAISNLDSILLLRIHDPSESDSFLESQRIAHLSYPTLKVFPKRLYPSISQFWMSVNDVLEYIIYNFSKTSLPLDNILINLSSLSTLRWLVFTKPRILLLLLDNLLRILFLARKFIDRSSHISLASFLIIRSLFKLITDPVFHTTNAPLYSKKRPIHIQMQRIQKKFASRCYNQFVILIEKIGLTWKSVTGIQAILQCLMCLLNEVPNDILYCISFLAMRQIALILRYYMSVNSPNHASHQNNVADETLKLSKKKASKQLFNWSIIYRIRILSHMIFKQNPHLNALLFPLATLLITIIKATDSALMYLPFSLHSLELLCDMMDMHQKYIPFGFVLMKAGEKIIHLQNKTSLNKSINPKSQNINSTNSEAVLPKAIDIDITLSIKSSETKNHVMLDNLFSHWNYIMVFYLGTISRHPSFPETVLPLLYYLKKLSKHSKPVTQYNLKQLILNCNHTIKEIHQLRLSINPSCLSATSFFFFKENETTLSRLKVQKVKDQQIQKIDKLRKETNIIKEREFLLVKSKDDSLKDHTMKRKKIKSFQDNDSKILKTSFTEEQNANEVIIPFDTDSADN